MTRKIWVHSIGTRYPVMVGDGLLHQAGEILRGSGLPSSPIVISNRRVMRFHGQALLSSLERTFGAPKILIIRDGERFKDHKTLAGIYRALIRAGADRRSWIAAFGGGVVGDLAGFAAATFLRGICYVQIPTSLLAQIDSAIGGKVGVNIGEGKNLVGAFHPPAAVIADTAVLQTLPHRELCGGLFEAIKSAAIRSPELFRYFETNIPSILEAQPEALERLVRSCIRIKAAVVSRDERESGEREILNFGHTIGHALEAATDYRRFKHGEAVAWGMLAAASYSVSLKIMDERDARRLVELVRQVTCLPGLSGIGFSKFWAALSRDKKKRSGRIRMVLLRRLGQTMTLEDAEPGHLRPFLARFLRKGPELLSGRTGFALLGDAK